MRGAYLGRWFDAFVKHKRRSFMPCKGSEIGCTRQHMRSLCAEYWALPSHPRPFFMQKCKKRLFCMPQPCKCMAYALFLQRTDTHPYYLQLFVARFEAVAVFNILKKWNSNITSWPWRTPCAACCCFRAASLPPPPPSTPSTRHMNTTAPCSAPPPTVPACNASLLEHAAPTRSRGLPAHTKR